MRVLITGGLGYLGGRLAQFLADQPKFQIVLGTRQVVESLQWLPHAQVRQVLWDSSNSLKDACANVDAVIHTAGMNAQDCADDPVLAFEFNAVATGRLVNAAIQQQVKRFIYLSTAHVYCSPLVGTITEKTCPQSLHPYAASHRAGEDLVRAADQRGEIEGIVIRLSNSFGEPAHKDANCWMLLINDLCRQAVSTKCMVLHSSGMQRRDFVPISDVNHAIDYLLQCPAHTVAGRLFNVGGEWTPTIWEVACIVQARCKAVLGFEPDIIRPLPDNGAISSNLDYRIDLLKNVGFQLKANRYDELDGLLKFCDAEFS